MLNLRFFLFYSAVARVLRASSSTCGKLWFLPPFSCRRIMMDKLLSRTLLSLRVGSVNRGTIATCRPFRANIVKYTAVLDSRSSIFPIQRRLFGVTPARFAGHSKWQNIRHIKAAKDGERAKLIASRTYEIRRAIKDAGGNANPVSNSALASAIERAKADGVPAASIQNALKKDEKEDSKPYSFELRGPAGTFFIVEVLTNNLRRTKQLMQPPMNKCKTAWADAGARRLFEHQGLVKAKLPEDLLKTQPVDLDALSEKILDYAIDVGAEEAGVEEEEIESENVTTKAPVAWFQCAPDDVPLVRTKVIGKGFDVIYAEAVFEALSTVAIDDAKTVAMITRFLEALDDIDDVLRVHDNIDWESQS